MALYLLSAPLAYVSVYLSYALFVGITLIINVFEHVPHRAGIEQEF
jgi:hypothetical protein